MDDTKYGYNYTVARNMNGNSRIICGSLAGTRAIPCVCWELEWREITGESY